MARYDAVYKTPILGEKYFKEDRKFYEKEYGKYSDIIGTALTDVREGIGEAKGLRDYYRPGGGYGGGLREEAREEVGKGVARSSVQSVQSGMSSMFGSRGINVLAGAELSKLYKNIEDTRNQLLIQAFQPYAQMIQTLGQLATSGSQLLASRPTFASSVKLGQPYVTSMRRTL